MSWLRRGGTPHRDGRLTRSVGQLDQRDVAIVRDPVAQDVDAFIRRQRPDSRDPLQFVAAGHDAGHDRPKRVALDLSDWMLVVGILERQRFVGHLSTLAKLRSAGRPFTSRSVANGTSRRPPKAGPPGSAVVSQGIPFGGMASQQSDLWLLRVAGSVPCGGVRRRLRGPILRYVSSGSGGKYSYFKYS